MRQAVPYYRVSTARQGRSGLGIEAQRAAVTRFPEGEAIVLLGEHAELGADADPFMLHLYAALAEKERRPYQGGALRAQAPGHPAWQPKQPR